MLAEHQRVKVQWDTESRTDAYDQMRDIAASDPDAAAYLSAHLDTPLVGQRSASQNAYDPIALYARVMRFYKGALTYDAIQQMSYVTFFALVREVSLIAEEENRETHKSRPTQDHHYPYDA